jgi:cystathionine gamma-lyase
MKKNHSFETLAIHAGQPPDPTTGAVMTPIFQTSTYEQEAVGVHKGFEYSRTANPTRSALEACLTALEGGYSGFAFASGMAATDAVLKLLDPGDHILTMSDLYGGSYRIFQHVYAKYGIQATYVPVDAIDRIQDFIQPETRLVWLESPSNPYLHLIDIGAISDSLKKLGNPPLLCVDNTFATPYLQQPLKLGADIVLHSTTKYLGGHSDVVGGALIVADDAIAEQIGFLQNAVGAIQGPMDSFLVLRGIKTLPVRMDRHAENAHQIAHYLQEHPNVSMVFYPGLPSHPQHHIAKKQMRNGGGMISFVHRDGPEAATRFVEVMELFLLAESLGGVESLIEIPAVMTHASSTDSTLSVDPALIRLSVGLEAAEDLIHDLELGFQSS